MGGEAGQHWVRAEAELRAEADGTTNPGDDAAPGTAGTGEAFAPPARALARKMAGYVQIAAGLGG